MFIVDQILDHKKLFSQFVWSLWGSPAGSSWSSCSSAESSRFNNMMWKQGLTHSIVLSLWRRFTEKLQVHLISTTPSEFMTPAGVKLGLRSCFGGSEWKTHTVAAAGSIVLKAYFSHAALFLVPEKGVGLLIKSVHVWPPAEKRKCWQLFSCGENSHSSAAPDFSVLSCQCLADKV